MAAQAATQVVTMTVTTMTVAQVVAEDGHPVLQVVGILCPSLPIAQPLSATAAETQAATQAAEILLFIIL